MVKETGIEDINEAIKKAINEALLEAQDKYEYKKMIENVVLRRYMKILNLIVINI